MVQTRGAKHEQLTQAARTLFFKHGIKRVTIDEICRTADVSKMTFYKYFRDKTELVRAVISRIAEDRLAGFTSVMSLDAPFPERMRRLVQMRLEQAEEVNRDFLRELYVSPRPEIHEFIHQKTREALATAMDYYRKAQEEGAIRADMKPEFISWFLNHIVDMMGDERLVAMYDSSRELAAEVINFFLFGILARKE
ncbi:MAG: TetR/AcrR family transcriptional regulator [Candidatus Aminicenantes bacterium]|nr:TetR/AcrR family transcriptional regulator [Candidatus Aminicenantes bacterium]